MPTNQEEIKKKSAELLRLVREVESELARRFPEEIALRADERKAKVRNNYEASSFSNSRDEYWEEVKKQSNQLIRSGMASYQTWVASMMETVPGILAFFSALAKEQVPQKVANIIVSGVIDPAILKAIHSYRLKKVQKIGNDEAPSLEDINRNIDKLIKFAHSWDLTLSAAKTENKQADLPCGRQAAQREELEQEPRIIRP